MLNQIKSFFQNLFSKAEVEQVVDNFGATDIASLVKNGAFLVDMRTESEFQQGHAPGSINVPLSKLGRNMSLFDGKKSIVVFCHSGNRSEYAKDVLVNKGIKNVYNGGAWADIEKIINQ